MSIETKEWREKNQANWNERVAAHVASDFYGVDRFLDGECMLRDFEVAALGDVTGQSLIHLQCHFGLDTLSWARRGANVTGLDFSAPAIAAANDIAKRASLPATFVEADVYEAPQALNNDQYDIVYTGLRAINWLPDITAWAQVLGSLVKPGGTVLVSEFHPFSHVFGDDDLSIEYPYFRHGPYHWNEPGTYAEVGIETISNETIEWHYTVSDIVNALVQAGLRIDHMTEHDYTLFPRWPQLEKDSSWHYRFPQETPSLPLMMSVRAVAPT